MTKLKRKIVFETTFDAYEADSVVGEGGAGRVYGGAGSDGSRVAIKLLTASRASSDSRRRFKNEIAFLSANKHGNIVSVIDHGLQHGTGPAGPFYVMQRYDCHLRKLIADGIEAERALSLFSQVLDGVEAAHLQGVIHRDLKPENILYDQSSDRLAVADFGIARFHPRLLATAVKTKQSQRMANFQYAAPEQRIRGGDVGVPADLFALGLILNEMITGTVPAGSDYPRISAVSSNHAFLDRIVEQLISNSPAGRPASIAELKGLILRYRSEAVSLQRLSELQGTVVKEDEIDDPLAFNAPQIVDAVWDGNALTMTLDRPVSTEWVRAFRDMGGYRCRQDLPPSMFSFDKDKVFVRPSEQLVQEAINYLKDWLPIGTRNLHLSLKMQNSRRKQELSQKLKREREREARRLQINRNLKV